VTVPSFGSRCRLASRPGEVLVLEVSDAGARIVPYPADPSAEPELVPLTALDPIGEDSASARILRLRGRSAAASRRTPTTPPRALRSAMVLCAGLGTRLRPLTLQWPKPAMPFFGAPLVRYSFALLAGVGVRRVVINTHYLPERMAEVAEAEASLLGLELAVSHEPEIQGTGGAIREAADALRGEPFVLVNGDAFCSFDLAGLIAAHQARGAAATMAVAPMPPGESFAAVEATPEGEVRRIAGHGPSTNEPLTPWHFLGVHVIEPRVLDHVPARGAQDINRTVYPALLATGDRVQACPVPLGAWADLGTPKRYLTACEELLTGLAELGPLGRSSPLPAAEAARLRLIEPHARCFVDPTAVVSPKATLEGSIVGPKAIVEEGAVLRRAVVLPGTRIRKGEHVEEALAEGELRVSAR